MSRRFKDCKARTEEQQIMKSSKGWATVGSKGKPKREFIQIPEDIVEGFTDDEKMIYDQLKTGESMSTWLIGERIKISQDRITSVLYEDENVGSLGHYVIRNQKAKKWRLKTVVV